ncbi:MAG: phosphatase PAP2 family protein [Anaerolineae bacterium]|nr:phosphatase PAP2 family protein [Anaerolineae bacterium]
MSASTPQGRARYALGLHLATGFLVIMLALYLFGQLASGVLNGTPLVQFDQNLELAVHAWARPAITPLFIVISMLGFQVLWIVVVLVAGWFIQHRQWLRLMTWIAGWAGGELLNQLLKQIFARPRPFFADALQTAANYSFPSGHAMFSAVAYGLLAYFMLLQVRRQRTRIAIVAGTVVLVLLIGFSRIYLGVHYFSDVVAGFAFGVAWLSVCITGMDVALNRLLIYRRRRVQRDARAS